ncbi:O-antigen ligase family protein [Candidatus Roizmanbacteria bacterium]|nr:O-antigen ligase family protein [Candidatus Roizmanbacteria bacterium]
MSSAVFLLRIPPLYIFPLRNTFLNSYNIAGYFVLILFIAKCYEHYLNNQSFFVKKRISILLILFLVSQSLSILMAVNILEFLARYKNIVLGLMIFIIAKKDIYLQKRIKSIVYVIFFSILTNIVFELVLYFRPILFFKPFITLLAQRYMDDFELNSARNRYFVNIYDAALIPLIFILFGNTKQIFKKTILGLTVITISFFSFVSNFRTQLIVLLITLIASGKIYFTKNKPFVTFFLIVLTSLFIINMITVNNYSYNALDRVITPDSYDYKSLYGRFYYWSKAIDMGISSPIFGIGLGNYYDFLTNKIFNKTLLDPKDMFFKITWVHPHNVFFGTFAESGFFGLITFILILIFFANSDLITLLHKNNTMLNLFIISFWSLFLFSLVNPCTSLSYISLFWLLRGMIVSMTLN